MEKETRTLIASDFQKEVDVGILKLTVLNLEEPESKALVEQHGIWGSYLLLVNNRGRTIT